MGAKKSKNATAAQRAKLNQVEIKLVDECLKCQNKCGPGLGYIKSYEFAKANNKSWAGKGVACRKDD